jgi:hypothetical protein
MKMWTLKQACMLPSTGTGSIIPEGYLHNGLVNIRFFSNASIHASRVGDTCHFLQKQ